MTACGRSKCQGPKLCMNFGEHGCKGVDWNLPPWETTARLSRLNQILQQKIEEANKAKEQQMQIANKPTTSSI